MIVKHSTPGIYGQINDTGTVDVFYANGTAAKTILFTFSGEPIITDGAEPPELPIGYKRGDDAIVQYTHPDGLTFTRENARLLGINVRQN